MSSERWARVQELFHAALEQTPDARAAFLSAECGADHDLRNEVTSLLGAHEQDTPLDVTPFEETDILHRLAAELAGRYVVKRELATGGMSTVFLAEDIKHNRNVAIKVLRPDLTVTIGSDRFLREIEIAAGLQHPHILPLYDSGTADGLLYYVMPFVEGDTLWDRIRRSGKLPERDALRITTNILSALEYAHRKGIVHRDIKPSNVLISASGGHAVVADFGIARAVSEAAGEGLTITGAAIGTPGYMPPEQASGKPVTPATDVYAVGLVLYECLTGRRWSFDADMQEGDWSGVPAALEPVLKRALAWSPAKRWPDASAFSRALHHLEAQPTSWRRPAAISAAAVVGLLGIVAGGWALFGGSAASPPPEVTRFAVLPFSVRGSGEFSYLGEGMVDLLSTKLDGAGSWRSVDPRVVLSIVGREGGPGAVDPAAGRRIASQLGADIFVLGNIVEVGGEVLRLDASLYRGDDGDAAVVQASAEGGATEVLSLLDRMAAQLLAGQREAGDTRLTQLALVTTDSLPALKSYLRGIRALRGAAYPEAASAFQEAVAVDSTFALAWYQLSIAADWLLQADVGRDAAEQAVRFADRLSERDRRLLEAQRTARQGDAAGAERLYRAIIGTYPQDAEAWSQLGEILMHYGALTGAGLQRSREAWERLAALEPERVGAYVHLARLEASEGNLDALDAAAQRAIDLVPEGDRTLEMRVLQAFSRDDQSRRDRVAVDLANANDDVLVEAAWSASAFLGDPVTAEPLIRPMTDGSRSLDVRALGYEWLAYLAIGQGHWGRATTLLDTMETIDPVRALETRSLLSVVPELPSDTNAWRSYRDRLRTFDGRTVPPSAARGTWFTAHDGLHEHFRLYLLGLLNAVLGDGGTALARSRELEDLGSPVGTGSLVPDLALGIRATIAWHEDRMPDAAEHLDSLQSHIWYSMATSSAFQSEVYERYLRARVLEATGRFDEALRWYGSFDDAGAQSIVFYALSHWRRGHIYEARGDGDTARRHYEQFLSAWVDSDAVFAAIVEDARQGLARVTPS
jgi:tetratricopeptide (TPR) repeat protein